MTTLYPRLPLPVAEVLMAKAEELQAEVEHPSQVFAPIGGRRATQVDIRSLADKVRALAGDFGFPGPLTKVESTEFDRKTSQLLVASMDMSWSEASSKEVWSFLALVALPEVTRWRFGTTNRERWIGMDLTRHTWARAWWRGTVFSGRIDLLAELTESDLNQILERRSIGGDPRLAVGLADALIRAGDADGVSRRALIRDSSARLRRRLAFIDPRALEDAALIDLCDSQIHESIVSLVQRSANSAD